MHASGIDVPPCPLCRGLRRTSLAAHDRRWWDCATCGLAAVDPRDLPDPDEERTRYETHENDPEDPDYRAFLDRVAVPLVARLEEGMEGLDVGSGPGPTLSVMLRERGFPTRIWDPIFAPDPTPLGRTWDFVTCTETVEHFHHPARDWARLFGLLRPGGWLAIMTEPLGDTPLADWWYARDPTHVSLYRDTTLAWVAERFGADLERPERRVAIYRV